MSDGFHFPVRVWQLLEELIRKGWPFSIQEQDEQDFRAALGEHDGQGPTPLAAITEALELAGHLDPEDEDDHVTRLDDGSGVRGPLPLGQWTEPNDGA